MRLIWSWRAVVAAASAMGAVLGAMPARAGAPTFEAVRSPLECLVVPEQQSSAIRPATSSERSAASFVFA